MEKNQTVLGVLYIFCALLEKELLHKDPNIENNILVYRTSGDKEGWYSQNIYEAASESFQNKHNLEALILEAKKNEIDVNDCFKRAYDILEIESLDL